MSRLAHDRCSGFRHRGGSIISRKGFHLIQHYLREIRGEVVRSTPTHTPGHRAYPNHTHIYF